MERDAVPSSGPDGPHTIETWTCCRDWPIARTWPFGANVQHCGLCGERPEPKAVN